MEILGMGAFLLIMFLITWVVIACNAPSATKIPSFFEHSVEVDLLKAKIEVLQDELSHIKENCRRYHNDRPYETRYFAQTIEQQKMADMLAKARGAAEQLVKELTA